MVMVRIDYSPVVKTTPMNAIEKQLQQLALEIKQYPLTNARNKLTRRRELTKLQNLIIQSGKLETAQKSLQNKYQPQLGNNLFKDCYTDALQKTWLYIFSNIEQYNPQKATVLHWFSLVLEWRFLDVKNDYLKIRKIQRDGKIRPVLDESLNKSLQNKKSNEANESTTYQDILKSEYFEDQSFSQARQFKQLIIEDPWLIFSGKHIKNCPQASYQEIAIQRINDKKWKEIAHQFNLPIPTISSFLLRSNTYFKAFFYEYLYGEFRLSEATQKLLIEDRKDKFKQTQIEEHPAINFQMIMLDKIAGKSWSSMAKQLNSTIPLQLIIYFYLDSIKRFNKIFKDEFNLFN